MRPFVEEGGERPAGRPPRAHHEDAAPREGDPVVVPEVPDEPDPVGVVPVDRAAAPERERVDRARELGPGGADVGEREGFLLEREGHVHPEPARGPEPADDLPESVPRGGERVVTDPLPGHRREPSVDERRLRVADGMAGHRVAIGGTPNLSHLLVSRPAPFFPILREPILRERREWAARASDGGPVVAGGIPTRDGGSAPCRRIPPVLWSHPPARGEKTAMPTRIIEDVIRRVREAVPVEEIGDDLRRNIEEAIAATLARMDVVTREELDGHLEILAEAQARMKALEERIEAIEAGAGTASGPDSPHPC